MTRKAGCATLLAALVAAGSGCVAVNVGKPEVYKHTEMVTTTNRTPVSSEVVSVKAQAAAEGNQLNAWLDAEVREEYPQWQHNETVTVKKQKRLAMGLFPGGAERFLVPQNALVTTPSRDTREIVPEGKYVTYHDDYGKDHYCLQISLGEIVMLGIPAVLGTIDTLLFEPFSGWRKTDEVLDATFGSASSPATSRIKALRKFPASEREAMGIITCFDLHVPHGLWGTTNPTMHYWGMVGGLIGVYKYNTIVVEGPSRDGPDSAIGNMVKRRTESLPGPYEVELEIREKGISAKKSVGAGESRARFDLPPVDGGGSCRATLTFRPIYGAERSNKPAWQTQTLNTVVALPEKTKPKPVPTYTPSAPQAPVREVVEVHHYHETRVVEERKPEGAPWEIETVEAFRGGRAVYLVTIRDASRKAFEVEREVRPEIERNLRDAFAASMPGMDERRVRAYAVAEYEGRAIRFRGVAFSVQPLTDGWLYDADTHRGSVRLRISEGMSPEEAKRWARDNIETIVNEKNVALKAGEAPPAGAVYRSLGESLEDGVLTVEFEAVE